jgi:DNA-binding NarL/FixJ family response regulator
MNKNRKIKVHLADDNKSFCKAFADIFGKKYNFICSSASNEKEFFSVIESNFPDVIVCDIYSCFDNLEVLMQKILQRSPKSKLAVLSFETGEEFVNFCLACGVKGFFDKAITDIDLMNDAIEKIDKGETIVLAAQTVY